MALIYVTGSPGTGKSTICVELIKRGYEAYDEVGYTFWYDKNTGTPDIWLNDPSTRTPEWYKHHQFKFKRELLEKLAKSSDGKNVFICSQTFFDNEVWDLFETIIFLEVDPPTLQHRLNNRKSTDYGKQADEQAYILKRYTGLRELHKKHGAIMIDSVKPVDEVVAEIINKVAHIA